jgi:hypothetical protein
MTFIKDSVKYTSVIKGICGVVVENNFEDKAIHPKVKYKWFGSI